MNLEHLRLFRGLDEKIHEAYRSGWNAGFGWGLVAAVLAVFLAWVIFAPRR